MYDGTVSAGTHEEDIENAVVELCRSLGWAAANVYHETYGPKGTLGRDNRSQIVLERRLRPALAKLNPTATPLAIEQAVEELTRDRSASSRVQANRDIHKILLDGFRPTSAAADANEEEHPRVRIIDWDQPDNNDFFLAQQLWIRGTTYERRADLVGFVNGLPLVFIELKNIDKRIEDAYNDNFRDYLEAVPQLFWHNALVLLSNGLESRIGSITSAFEHFKAWKRIEREDETPQSTLEVMIRGVCDKSRLLDIVENFTVFSDQRSSTAKIIAQNHQFLGVNNALEAVKQYQLAEGQDMAQRRRLGVFWHTQGSGKSFSMVFFSQKIQRKLRGNWTFVVVTDRDDLDSQIYKTFIGCGAVQSPGTGQKAETEQGVQAKSGEHLKRLLKEDHRYVFTLIQKFRTEVKGAKYPMISDRSDIIVMADEAHRTQYDTFALNLRNALPNAAFIGFTGTPLLAGEEKTMQVFGDYVSVYNFRQAVEDNATVPLWYEARIPPLQLTNEDLSEDLDELLEEAELNEEQQKKVEREFARQYHLITRDDRLNEIAKDIVDHFLGQPEGTKGMMVAIDKLTAVRMYDKVRSAWRAALEKLEMRLRDTPYNDEKAKSDLIRKVGYMKATDMAVVVSQAQNEVETFAQKGLDIASHRKRMVNEDLDTKFKDDKDPLRLVFVCAMWMTGFDVPSCGVIYLDKPMRNHTLMQTIARANRVYEGKQNGFIVDYIGVFRDLKKALAIYGPRAGGGVREGDVPIEKKEKLVEELRKAIGEANTFCKQAGVDVEGIRGAKLFERIRLLKDGTNKLTHPLQTKKTFLNLAGQVDKTYRSLGLDAQKNEFSLDWGVFEDLCRGLRQAEKPVDISKVMAQVERLLDESIDASGYELRERTGGTYEGKVHLGGIDFAALTQWMATTKHSATAAQALAVATRSRAAQKARMNPTRSNLRDDLDQLIADYNAGAKDVQKFFQELLAFMKKLEAEDRRPNAEGLTEEELAFFDLLMAGMTLEAADRDKVKAIARELPGRLAKKLVIDWRKSQRARAAVRATITDALDQLPEAYGEDAFGEVVEAVYLHVDDSYYGEGKSKYVSE